MLYASSSSRNARNGDYSYTLIDPKENKQRRIILAETAMLTLQKQRTKQQRQRLAAGPLWNNPFDLVFTNEFGRALNHQTVYKHLKASAAFLRYGRLHVPFSAPLIRYDFVRKRR